MNIEKINQLTVAHNIMTMDGLFQYRNREKIQSIDVSVRPNINKTFYGNLTDELEQAFSVIIGKYRGLIKDEIKKECGFNQSDS